jgi:hypothetical protein
MMEQRYHIAPRFAVHLTHLHVVSFSVERTTAYTMRGITRRCSTC